jgi:hypothetical protein
MVVKAPTKIVDFDVAPFASQRPISTQFAGTGPDFGKIHELINFATISVLGADYLTVAKGTSQYDRTGNSFFLKGFRFNLQAQIDTQLLAYFQSAPGVWSGLHPHLLGQQVPDLKVSFVLDRTPNQLETELQTLTEYQGSSVASRADGDVQVGFQPRRIAIRNRFQTLWTGSWRPGALIPSTVVAAPLELQEKFFPSGTSNAEGKPRQMLPKNHCWEGYVKVNKRITFEQSDAVGAGNVISMNNVFFMIEWDRRIAQNLDGPTVIPQLERIDCIFRLQARCYLTD